MGPETSSMPEFMRGDTLKVGNALIGVASGNVQGLFEFKAIWKRSGIPLILQNLVSPRLSVEPILIQCTPDQVGLHG